MKKAVIGIIILSIIASGLTSCKKEESKYMAKVGDVEISKVEVLWYYYMIEKNLSSDAKKYEDDNKGKSYWDQEANGTTVANKVREQVKTMMIYNQIMSDQAKKTERYKDVEGDTSAIEKTAEEEMKEVPDKIKDMGLDKESYVKVQMKIALANLYYKDAVELYDVSEEDVKKENPYSKDMYEDKDAYEKAIKEIIDDKKYEKFEKEYKELVDRYKVEIYDEAWDSVKVGDLAGLM